MTAIQANELTKYYGDTRGIEALTLAIEDGEVFGFLGPNGAGKTTTIRTLMGFQSPTGGSATVLGHDVTDRAAMIEAKRRIGYVPAEMGFDEGVTGRRFVRYHASLKGDERSEELLELFDPPMDRKIGEYSTGNKRKLALVLAFMHDPDLVIMDEPTSGLDPLMQERFYAFVRDERSKGKTFFFSSHVLSEVQKICDRVGIVRDGHLVELEDVETLLDRSGKRVSVHVAEPVAGDEFAIDGAHDVSIAGDDRPARLPAADGSADSSTGGGREGTNVSFTYTGDYNVLLEHLIEYDLLDLDIADAPLEDVFMRFYGRSTSGPRVEPTARANANRERARGGRMFEIARYEGERRLLLGAVVAAAASFYGAMFVALAPSFTDVDFESYLSSFPEQLVEAFGIEAMNTLPGLLAAELYQFGWVLVLGLYLAYSAASMIAGDVEAGRMNTLLSAPVARTTAVCEQFLSLLVPILAVNAITPLVIYVGAG